MKSIMFYTPPGFYSWEPINQLAFRRGQMAARHGNQVHHCIYMQKIMETIPNDEREGLLSSWSDGYKSENYVASSAEVFSC
jgi:hypothetical protein